MSRSDFSDLAQQDLRNIFTYIAADNPGAAAKFVASLEASCQSLADYPEMGERIAEPGGGAYRRFVVRNYVVLYRIIEGGVEIASVIHDARDIDKMF
ncbi:MAG: type II toxin-antitoxin system RelE/ParE family toxin [Planctomycetes bacterium]|nr:type II toxin-antitoxin system RelE/ParE family toxin [Planctomycetota bacterium]